jgi:hypothetical protein
LKLRIYNLGFPSDASGLAGGESGNEDAMVYVGLGGCFRCAIVDAWQTTVTGGKLLHA